MPDCWHFRKPGGCPFGKRCLYHHHSKVLPSRADRAYYKADASAAKKGEVQEGSHPSGADKERCVNQVVGTCVSGTHLLVSLHKGSEDLSI